MSPTCICIYVRAPSSKEPSLCLRYLERALNLLVPGASSTNSSWKLPSGRAALWCRSSMAQWSWCPEPDIQLAFWGKDPETTGATRPTGLTASNTVPHVASCQTSLFFATPISTHKRENKIYAFTSVIPATLIYLMIQKAKNHRISSAWGWRSANADSPGNTLAVCFSCITFTKWLMAPARADTSSGYCLGHCLCLRACSSDQLQTQMGRGFAEKPAFLPSAGLSPYKK